MLGTRGQTLREPEAQDATLRPRQPRFESRQPKFESCWGQIFNALQRFFDPKMSRSTMQKRFARWIVAAAAQARTLSGDRCSSHRKWLLPWANHRNQLWHRGSLWPSDGNRQHHTRKRIVRCGAWQRACCVWEKQHSCDPKGLAQRNTKTKRNRTPGQDRTGNLQRVGLTS